MMNELPKPSQEQGLISRSLNKLKDAGGFVFRLPIVVGAILAGIYIMVQESRRPEE